MRILITGTNSGLGKSLFEHFSAEAFDRQKNIEKYTSTYYDYVIHCAYNTGKVSKDTELSRYLNDTVFLTKKLLDTLKFKKFIFISTIDVYPSFPNIAWKEDMTIDPNEVKSLYGLTKLCCEDLVLSASENNLVLRPSAMFGPYSRPNSLYRIINNEASISLDGQSTFNYISHNDIVSFIEKAIELNLSGIYNLASQENVALKDIKIFFGSHTKFGKFVYKTPGINNEKALNILSSLKEKPLDKLQELQREII